MNKLRTQSKVKKIGSSSVAFISLCLLMLVLVACDSSAPSASTTIAPTPAMTMTPLRNVPPELRPTDSDTAGTMVSATSTREPYQTEAPSSTIQPSTIAPEPTAIPTETDDEAPTPVPIPVSRSLSTLEDPIKEQIEISIGQGGVGVPVCQNQKDLSLDDWLMAGHGTEKDADYDNPYLSDSIGLASTICIRSPQPLQDDDVITIEVIRADGQRDSTSYVVEASVSDSIPEERFISLTLVDETTADGRPRFHYYGNAKAMSDEYEGYSFGYFHLRADALGDYTTILYINDIEIEREQYVVGICDCPSMEVKRAGEQTWNPMMNLSASHSDLEIKSGDILTFEFTGFSPREIVTVHLIEQLTDKYPFVVQLRYSWTVEMDDRGEAYDEVLVDINVPVTTGTFFLIHSWETKKTEQFSEEMGIVSFSPGDLQRVRFVDSVPSELSSPVPPEPEPLTSGMRVLSVEPNSPAALAGIQPGHVIIRMNGQMVQTYADTLAIIDAARGQPMPVLIWDETVERELVVATPLEGPMGVDLCEVALCP